MQDENGRTTDKGGAVRTDVFANNRAHGRVMLEMGWNHGRARLQRAQEEGSLRVRFPHCEPDAAEAILVNTAGGIAGGDRFSLDVKLGPSVALTVSTAAAEKVYRSHGPDAEMVLRADIASGAHLSWLPQETILFERARLVRRIDISLAEGAWLLMAEAMVFGRTAMGEAVSEGSFVDHWRIRQGGRLIFADSLRLQGAIAQKLARRAVAAGSIAIATVLSVPGSQAQLDALRVRQDELPAECGSSCWNGVLLTRLCARDGQALQAALTEVLRMLQAKLPRSWI